MNRIYRLIWNHTLGAMVPVAEITRAKDVSARSQGRPARHRLAPLSGALLLALGLATPGAARAAVAVNTLQVSTFKQGMTATQPQNVVVPPVHPLPTGGQVASGQASISQSGNTLTIDQYSQNTIINWQSFSIGADQTVTFNQPGNSAVSLNRILGSDPSAIYGQLHANGQVFLVNPNGIYFAPGARVDVGGIVASTLGITNRDFLAGRYHFDGTSTAGIRNDGSISAATGGYVAFIGANVSNHGRIVTPEGTTALGAGGSVNLTLAGNRLLSFKVSSNTLNALAANGGLIQANGGTVILNAHARDALLQTVVNNTGQIQAQTVANHHGTIELLGGDSGTTQVAGILDASAPNGGVGGSIDTSGSHVKVADGTTITTKAASGNNGTWLIDPQDFTIAASGGDISGATLSTQLGSGNVTIQSSSGGATGNGDIFVNDTVSWSSNTLTLNALNNIDINSAMNAIGTAGLTLKYGQASTNGGGSTYYVDAPVNLATTSAFTTQKGTNGANLITWTIIDALGSAGSLYTSKDLQGINGDVNGHYVLGANIDASATSSWNTGKGFTPIGNITYAFAGILDGLGHTISHLYINRPGTNNVGLFAFLAKGGTVRNIGLVGGNVTGGTYNVGALAGRNVGGTISHAYATGSVNGGICTGGLVGWNSNGTIVNAHAAVSVTGTDTVGGVVGSNSGSISNSYATGSVTGSNGNIGGLVGWNSNGAIRNSYATGRVNGSNNVGGLVGNNDSSNSTVDNSYATGDTSGHQVVGGLVGKNGGAISNAYATGNVSASSSRVGGLVGANQGSNATISNAYATGRVSGSNTVGGVVGSNSNGIVSNAYWDTTTTGNIGYGTNDGKVTGGGGLTTTQLAGVLPSGFSSSIWADAGNQTTPYLLANASFSTVSGHVILGSDTRATPSYFGVIQNMTQLQNINSTGLSANYVLVANLTDSTKTGAGFTPIGNGTTNFTGVFDGLNHTISGLYINRGGSNDVGLLGVVGTNGTVRNVSLVGGSVTGNFRVGGLVGTSYGVISNAYAADTVSGGAYQGGLVGDNAGTIDNSHATGNVSSSLGDYIGGLVGYNPGGTIGNSYATGDVTSGGRGLGGLVGYSTRGTISNSYATGNVTGASRSNNTGGLIGLSKNDTVSDVHATGDVSANGAQNVGGLMGISTSNSINNAYATGNVSGGAFLGGLAGFNANTAITNAFATGNVSGGRYLGGLIGQNTSGSTISDAYATGSVSGGSITGGLVGLNGGVIRHVYATGNVSGLSTVGGLVGANSTNAKISNAYWDTTTSGQNAAYSINYGTFSSAGLTDTQMQQSSNFTGFDFTTAWVQYDGHTYPLLRSFMTALTVTSGAQSRTYDGTTAVTLGNPVYSVAGADTSGHLFGLSDAYGSQAVNVGTYTTSDLWSDQQGYIIDQSGVGALTITPKALTLSGLTAANKVYDGSTSASITGWGSLSGIIGSDSVRLGTSASTAAFADANAGNGKTVTVSGLSLTGSGAGNYVIQTQTTTADITPKALKLTGLTAANKVYDGSTAATVTSFGNLAGILSGDSVTLVSSGSTATFADANAGTGKTVTIGGLSLTGSSSGNYSIANPTTTADITPRALTVSLIGSPSKPYDGTTTAYLEPADFQLSGFVSGQGAGMAPVLGQYASANIGNGIQVTAPLDAGDFIPDNGTLLSNYLLPASVMGLGSITVAPPQPLQRGATASGSQAATLGYTGIDAFALLLDPQLQYSLTAPGRSSTVHLTVQQPSETSTESERCLRGTLDPFAAPRSGTCRKH